MVTVKVLQPFKYSPDGIRVVEVEKGKGEIPAGFVDVAVAEGWIEPPKKGGKTAADQTDPPPIDPPAGDPPPVDPPADGGAE